eukprot:gene15587-biopygen8385
MFPFRQKCQFITLPLRLPLRLPLLLLSNQQARLSTARQRESEAQPSASKAQPLEKEEEARQSSMGEAELRRGPGAARRPRSTKTRSVSTVARPAMKWNRDGQARKCKLERAARYWGNPKGSRGPPVSSSFPSGAGLGQLAPVPSEPPRSEPK